MKTLLRIEADFISNNAFDMWEEDIINLSNELNIYCETANTDFINTIQKYKKEIKSKENFNSRLVVSAKGYVQSEWQEYTVYYNSEEIKAEEKKQLFEQLKSQLEKAFTHKNDYFASLYEYEIIDGKRFLAEEAHDSTTFSILDIEFPDDEDIEKSHNEQFGVEYDSIEIDIS